MNLLFTIIPMNETSDYIRIYKLSEKTHYVYKMIGSLVHTEFIYTLSTKRLDWIIVETVGLPLNKVKNHFKISVKLSYINEKFQRKIAIKMSIFHQIFQLKRPFLHKCFLFKF